jgi:hypothetical protein
MTPKTNLAPGGTGRPPERMAYNDVNRRGVPTPIGELSY